MLMIARNEQDEQHLMEKLDFGLLSEFVIEELQTKAQEAYAKEQFPFEYALAEQILKKLEQELRVVLAKEEIGFLAIHIRRVTGGETV